MTLTRHREPTRRRIAMVAACPFPSLRGSQVLIRELAQALAARGHEVHVVTYPQGEHVVPVGGIRVHRTRPPRWIGRPSGLGVRRLLVDLWLTGTLLRVVRRERIEVLHAHNYEGPMVAYVVRLLCGVPVVYHSHNALGDELGYYFRPGWRRRLARRVGCWLDRQIPRRADHAIALTPELAEFLNRRGVPADRLTVVTPAASAGGALPAAMPDPFRGRFVVMYTGNFDAYQDLEVLGEGFAGFRRSAPAALLVLVTHAADWAAHAGAALRRLVADGGARVVVTPAFTAVRRLMARADILVCPRRSWSGFPIKLLNYLAAGRAIVAAEGSAKVLVHGETGVLFRNGDAHDLSLALWRLSVDAGLRNRLAEAARVTAGGAESAQMMAVRVEQIYEDLGLQGAEQHPRGGSGRSAAGARLIGRSIDRISATSTRGG